MILRTAVCIFFLGVSMYSYIDKQNQVTKLKIKLPEIAREIRTLRQENMHLQYAVDKFESPENLMALARTEPFAHLKHPAFNEIVTLAQGEMLPIELPGGASSAESKAKLQLTLGAKTK